jgi:hypothetical protein
MVHAAAIQKSLGLMPLRSDRPRHGSARTANGTTTSAISHQRIAGVPAPMASV